MIIKFWRRRWRESHTTAILIPNIGIKLFYGDKNVQSHRTARGWYMILQ